MFSLEGGFPGLVGGGTGCLYGALSWLLPSTTLLAFLGLLNIRSGSCSSPSSPSPVDRGDRLTSPKNFFLPPLAVPPQRSVRNEQICGRRREFNELTVLMALVPIGSSFPLLRAEFTESALGKGETEISLTKRSGLVRMWGIWGRVMTVWDVVKRAAGWALGSGLVTQQDHDLQGQQHSRSAY